MKTPRHIAIIMDGNGRWAKKRGLPRIMGHKKGVDSVKNIVTSCIKFKVEYLTLYAFSTENWLRPKREIKGLFRLLENFLDNEIKLFHDNGVRLRIIGDRDRLDARIRKKIEETEAETAGYGTLNLNIALSYGSRQEILNAARMLSKEVKNGRLQPEQIDERLFSKYLYTNESPDPDLLIRTSGEMRVSNFLLWQISYSEIYVTSKFWPDFREPDLEKAIEEYSKRERRFGK
ncbi:MAG: isoprenyl transferase [Candidatus Omnitrophica bacterium]|nr:isoprenyl transferase [Candidatus Omnitrophota bacterium]MBU4149788.1 isoprenyl transferase [Candidatus Omnitrophota bacterium]